MTLEIESALGVVGIPGFADFEGVEQGVAARALARRIERGIAVAQGWDRVAARREARFRRVGGLVQPDQRGSRGCRGA